MSKRDILLTTARELFSSEGFRATGIDTLLERAGVAKMTLYHHFESKDDLALAVVREVGERVLGDLAEIARGASAPDQALVATVAYPAADELAGGGCLFHHVCAEFKEPDAPLRLAVRAHKEAVQAHFEGLARRAGASDPQGLGRQLFVLFEGGLAGSESACSGAVAQAGVDAARALVAAACA